MELKKLKASLQLAKMSYDSDPSKAKTKLYEQALEAYEACQKTEAEKIAQVSGDSVISDVPEDTTKAGDVSGETDAVDPIAKTGEPAAASGTEEKKTEGTKNQPA